jgi:uroporphyrin-III C-methyltransferase
MANSTMAPVSLLTSIDSTSHIHLIVGSNPLAAARCAKSLEVGAKPLLIAPETADLHYALQKRIDNGEVKWLKKRFEDDDVLRLGREEIGGVVDAVFVTAGPRDPLSMLFFHSSLGTRLTRQAYTSLSSADGIASQ